MHEEFFYLFPRGSPASLEGFDHIVGFGGPDVEEGYVISLYTLEGKIFSKVFTEEKNFLGFLAYDDNEKNMVLVDDVDDKKVLEFQELSNNEFYIAREGRRIGTDWVKACVGRTVLVRDEDEEALESVYEIRRVEET